MYRAILYRKRDNVISYVPFHPPHWNFLCFVELFLAIGKLPFEFPKLCLHSFPCFKERISLWVCCITASNIAHTVLRKFDFLFYVSSVIVHILCLPTTHFLCPSLSAQLSPIQPVLAVKKHRERFISPGFG